MHPLIDRFQLSPHPEGGFYREVYRSTLSVRSSVMNDTRPAATHIYFLLLEGQVSRFHRVAHDELWHFYEGAPLRLVTYDGLDVHQTVIGAEGEPHVAVVGGGIYQAAESTGTHSLVGCTVAPGFAFEDFSFLSDDPVLKDSVNRNHVDFVKYV